MIHPLKYYSKNGIIIEFNKYTIGNGVIKNAKGEPMAYSKNKAGYNKCGVTDDNGKQRIIYVARAIASTIYGPPPSLAHTADHKDKNRGNDTDGNIRWLCKPGQAQNRDMPETNKSAFIIIKDGIEKTVKEWVEHLKGEKNPFGREYTNVVISMYAIRNQHGFSYKKYDDLPDEIWKEIVGSKTTQGRWEISDMNRVKYITKHAENVLSGERLMLNGGYPVIGINGKQWLCHILAFKTFFPDEYATKKPDEMVLHEDDDKIDFRPHKLRLGTQSKNITESHDNGCRDGTKTARMKCVSYIDGIYEIMHNSQGDGAKYLKSIGYDKANHNNIGKALKAFRNGKVIIRYDRTWKLST